MNMLIIIIAVMFIVIPVFYYIAKNSKNFQNKRNRRNWKFWRISRAIYATFMLLVIIPLYIFRYKFELNTIFNILLLSMFLFLIIFAYFGYKFLKEANGK